MDNMYKVFIDDDTADRIVVSALKLQMGILKKDISELKSRKRLEAHNKEDLADFIKNYDAIKTVYNYFGGNIR